MPLLLFLSAQFTYKRFLVFWALTGMLFTHSWLTEPTTAQGIRSFAEYSTLGCGLIAMVSFIFSILLNNIKFSIKPSFYVVGIILYGLIEILSSLINNSTSIGVLISSVIVPIVFGLSYIYAFSKEEVKLILWGIVVLGIIDVFVSYYAFLARIFDMDSVFLISGFFTDRNGFGRYLSIVNIFVLIEFFLQKQNLKKFFFGMLILLIFIGIAIQNSRSGYIVYLVSSAIIVFASGSKTAKKMALILLPFVLLLFIFLINIRIHQERMNIINYSDLSRIYVFKAGINMIKAHPFKGIGFRKSEANIDEYADKKLPGMAIMKVIHNWFVAIWAEMGVLELIIFCLLNFIMLFSSLKNYLRSGFIDGKYYLFTFTSLVILMFDALVLPNYDYESIYWIILAIGTICLTKGEPLNSNLKSASALI
jgi:O-antigen ligase